MLYLRCQMSKVGRPLKLNEIVIQMLEKAYSLGMSPKLACDHASVSQSSYNTWMQRGEQDRYDNKETIFADLNRRVKKARSNHALANLALIQKAAKEDGTWTAAAWLLERVHKEYQKQPEQIVEVNVDNRQLSVVQLMKELQNSDEEIKELIARPVIDLDEE